jgi:hypothetical protein
MHAQHQKHLLQKDDSRDPQVAFNQDMAGQKNGHFWVTE